MVEIAEILQGCKNNKTISQEKLYKLYYPALFSLTKLFFDDYHEALTALNNGMLKIYKSIHQFDESKGSLFNWMYTIVRNESITFLSSRKHSFEDIDSVKVEETEIGHYNFDKLEVNDICYCLNQLPLATRNVSRLCYLDGFSINEVAKILNISTGTIKWHLSEARKKLKPVLEKHYTLFASDK